MTDIIRSFIFLAGSMVMVGVILGVVTIIAQKTEIKLKQSYFRQACLNLKEADLLANRNYLFSHGDIS